MKNSFANWRGVANPNPSRSVALKVHEKTSFERFWTGSTIYSLSISCGYAVTLVPESQQSHHILPTSYFDYIDYVSSSRLIEMMQQTRSTYGVQSHTNSHADITLAEMSSSRIWRTTVLTPPMLLRKMCFKNWSFRSYSILWNHWKISRWIVFLSLSLTP